MAINKELFGLKDGGTETYAIEDLVFSTQVALQKAMNRKGVSNKELAERLGMSPARVSQIFSSNGPNLTLRTIGRIAHALGEDFELVSRQEGKMVLPEQKAKKFTNVVVGKGFSWTSATWEERVANSSKARQRDLVA